MSCVTTIAIITSLFPVHIIIQCKCVSAIKINYVSLSIYTKKAISIAKRLHKALKPSLVNTTYTFVTSTCMGHLHVKSYMQSCCSSTNNGECPTDVVSELILVKSLSAVAILKLAWYIIHRSV